MDFLFCLSSFHIVYGFDLHFVSYRLKMDCCKAVLPERSHIPGLLTICWRLLASFFAFFRPFLFEPGTSAGLNAL